MTPHQYETINKVLSKKDKVVGFWGEGGTGKSYSISKFIEGLSDDISVMMCTTTHQSLSVLKDMLPEHYKCNVETGTIHSFLGFRVFSDAGKTTLKKIDKDINSFDYLIIDESSYLTKQLLDFIYSDELSSKIREKIICVGDKFQLTIDGFLNLDSISSEELSVNMRQNEDSGLYKYCVQLREQIKLKGSPVPIESNGEDLILINNHTEFVSMYKKDCSDKIIIGFKNNTIKTYNSNIKQKLLKKSVYSIGDNLTILEPTFKQMGDGSRQQIFTNRERVQIVKVEDDSDDITTLLCKNKKGSTARINVPKNKTKYTERLNAYAKEKDWKNYYRMKEMFNFVHHNYALTVYSAQGSTFDNVYIDLSDFNPPNDPMNDKLMRMVYVALTRARKKAIVYLGSGVRDYAEFGRK